MAQPAKLLSCRALRLLVDHGDASEHTRPGKQQPEVWIILGKEKK